MTTGTATLSPEHLTRYRRQVALPSFGVQSQRKLLNARVLIIGAGGLGCPVGIYLAGAGVGNISIMDHDVVEITNLHRQIAYSSSECGMAKAPLLAGKLKELNPSIESVGVENRFDQDSATEVLRDKDLVIDASDNLTTRRLVAELCWRQCLPLVQCAIRQYSAQINFFIAGRTACYSCLFPKQALFHGSCSEEGVLGVVAGAAGLLLANEAVNYLATGHTSSIGNFLMYESLSANIKKLSLEADPQCEFCGSEASPAIESN